MVYRASDDTLGLQSVARWNGHGRLVVEADSALTLVRMALDTTRGGGDVALARFDFNPAVARETSTRSPWRGIGKLARPAAERPVRTWPTARAPPRYATVTACAVP